MVAMLFSDRLADMEMVWHLGAKTVAFERR
jgi:hypothetical protein